MRKKNQYRDNVCKECFEIFLSPRKRAFCSGKCQSKFYRKNNPEIVREYERRRHIKHNEKRNKKNINWIKNNREKANEYCRNYIKNNPDAVRKRYVNYIKNNPEAYKSHEMVRRALNYGKLKKKPCMVCGKKRVHAHHNDYKNPLDVIWLCCLHHAELHKNRRENNE